MSRRLRPTVACKLVRSDHEKFIPSERPCSRLSLPRSGLSSCVPNKEAESETRGEKAETRFVSIDKADITGVEVKNKSAQVTVRFISQLVSVTRDRDGNVIDGSPDKVTDVTDVWTFARDLASRDPNWKLVATEAGQ